MVGNVGSIRWFILVRNAVYHGIEPTLLLVSLETGRRHHLSARRSSGELGAHRGVENDGAGLDLVKIKGQGGEAGAGEGRTVAIARLPENELIKFIFLRRGSPPLMIPSGQAGRGVGMDIGEACH